MKKHKGPKVLFLDIETAPMLGYIWSIWEQNVPLNMLKADWHLLSWSAKWLGDSKIFYQDQRNAKNVSDDKKLLEGIWKLLDEADVIVTQNGKSFDQKKLNTRFILNGMGPPSPFKHIDTKRIATKHFAFTSNKLEYMSDKLCTTKKNNHAKFPGFKLWEECLKGNKEAWKEMELYNKSDVITLEELYNKMQPWDNTVAFHLYAEADEVFCNCGGTTFQKRGHAHTKTGQFQRYQCQDCGSWYQGKTNLLSKSKRSSLMKKL